MKKQNLLIFAVFIVVIAGISGCAMVDSLDPMAPQNKEYAGGDFNSNKA